MMNTPNMTQTLESWRARKKEPTLWPKMGNKK